MLGTNSFGYSTNIQGTVAIERDYTSGNVTLHNFGETIFVGGAGNLKVDTLKSTGITFTGLQAGTILPVLAIKIYQTGSTATALVSIR